MNDIGYVSIRVLLARLQLNPYIRSEFNERTAIQLIGQCLSTINYKEVLEHKATIVDIVDYQGEFPLGLKQVYQVLYRLKDNCKYVVEEDCLCKIELPDDKEEEYCEKKKTCCDPLIIERKYYDIFSLPSNPTFFNTSLSKIKDYGFKPIYTSSTNFNLGIDEKNRRFSNGNAFGNEQYSIGVNSFNTTFRNGELLVGYGSTPLDEEGLPLIPNDELIMQLCEHYYYYNTLKWLTYSTVDKNATTLYNDSRNSYYQLLGRVKANSKMPRAENIYKAAKYINRVSANINGFNNYFGYY